MPAFVVVKPEIDLGVVHAPGCSCAGIRGTICEVDPRACASCRSTAPASKAFVKANAAALERALAKASAWGQGKTF